ncbi:hypothetical protein ACI3L1_03980 [Deinococcus sp. SM5_A1]|uniref:hypothetical protein n=1 Tax=Deinococcus sp. SM5_A1 TaxID=3379094 RepID=UPI00385BBDF8
MAEIERGAIFRGGAGLAFKLCFPILSPCQSSRLGHVRCGTTDVLKAVMWIVHPAAGMLLDAVQGIIATTLKAGGREMLTQGRCLKDQFGRPADACNADDLKV